MAGPLGGFLGPLAYAGEPPITGWLKGLVEGEERQRKFGREDQESQLRRLQILREMQMAGAPKTIHIGNRLVNVDPRTGLPIGAPIEFPPDPGQQSLLDLHRAQQRAAEARARQAEAGTKDPLKFWEGRLADSIAAGDEKGAQIAEGILKRMKQAGAAPARETFHLVTDEKGNITLVSPRRGASGELEAETKDLGHIGKIGAAGAAAAWTPESIEYAAQRFAITGQFPPLGFGSAQLRGVIFNRAAEITAATPGGIPEQILRQAAYKADIGELTQLQAQRGKILAFARTAEKNLNMVEDLSKRVDRTGAPVINRWILAGRRGLGDPTIGPFDLAIRTAINEFAKVTTSATAAGGVVSDTARKEVEAILNTAMTPEQISAVIKTARQELANREAAYEEQIQVIQSNLRSLGQPGGATKEEPPPPGFRPAEPAAPAPAPPAAAPTQGTLGTAPPSARSPILQGSPLVTPPGAAGPATVPGRLGTSPLSPNQVAALRARGYTNVTTVEQARNLGVPIPPPETPVGLRQRSPLMTPSAAAPVAPVIPGRLGTPPPASSRSPLLQRSPLVTPPSRVTPPPTGKLPEDIIPAPTPKEKEDFRKAWPKGHPEAAPGSIESQRRATEALSPKDREFAPSPLTPPSRGPVVSAPTPDEIERYAFHQWASDNNLDAATPKAKQRWESLSVLDKGRYYQRVTQELLRSRREQMERR